MLTSDGPTAADALSVGDEVLGACDGRPVWARLSGVAEDPRPSPAIRLLTRGGKVVVDPSARLGTPRGLVRASELSDGDRLELLDPSEQLPEFQPPGRRLGRLAGMAFRLPTDNDCAGQLEPRLRQLLTAAGAECAWQPVDRWLAIKIVRVDGGTAWSWDDHAVLMEHLCAWGAVGGVPSEMRALMDGSEAADLLLGALIGAHRRFSAQWIPAFLPRELRVEPGAPRWQAYTPISRVLVEERPITELSVATDRWSPFSGLALVRP